MSSSIKSAAWMLFASLNFALLNSLVKLLSKDFHLTQIIFFRSFFAVVFILPWIFNDGIKSLKTNSYRLQVYRSLFALAAMYLWFFSISNIPLAKATAINFTAPVFGAIFAIFLLKEKIKEKRFFAIIFSFFGAIIIIRPGFIEINFYIITALVASILMGAAAIFIKKLSMMDHPNSIVFYMPTFLAIVSLIPCIRYWQSPNYNQCMLLIATGLTATLAHQAISRAFALSDATYVLVFDYVRLPFTAIFAFYLFGELTSIWIWVGGFIIFASSSYIVYREKKTGKKIASSLIAKKLNQ